MNRSTAFFILIAAALFSYIYLVESKEKGTKEKEASEKKLFDLTASKINKLTISHEESTIELIKKGNEWKIIKPIASSADLSAVEQILSELEFVETRRTIPIKEIEDLDATLKQWGLSTPATKITAYEEKKKYELIVGRKIAVSDLYYAKKSSDRSASVELISSFSRNNFQKKLNDLRSKDLLKFNSSEVRKISLKQVKGESTLFDEKELQYDKNQWTLQKPIKARGDREQINSWISNALGIKVERFISDDSSNLNIYGLSSPKSQITFSLENNTEQTLLFGVPTPDQPKELYAKQLHSNSVFTIKSEALEKLLALTPEWRDKHLLPSFSPSDITTLKINIKNKLYSFQNENNQWMLSSASGFLVDADKINGVLKSIQELKASQFVRDSKGDLKTFGLEKPSSQISIERKVGDEITKIDLLFGKTDKNLIYVMNSIEPFIFSIPIGFNSDWPKETWQWRSLHLLNTPVNEFQRIKIANRKELQTSLVLDEKGNWGTENSPSNLDPNKLSSLLAKLGDLRGVRWVSVTPTPAYELNPPHLKVELISNSGTKTLKVGNILPSGGRVAQLENVEGYFEMTIHDFEILTQNLIATEAPPISSNTEVAPTK